MRPISITGVQLRRSGEHIDDSGRWAPMASEWSAVIADEMLRQVFNMAVKDLTVIDERADYRNWVIEARYVTVPVAVEDLGDVLQVLDQGRVTGYRGGSDTDEEERVVMRPWVVERLAGGVTASPCPSGVLAIVVAPVNAPRDEIIALLDEQLS